MCFVLDLHLEAVKSTPLGLFRGLYVCARETKKSVWIYGHAGTAVLCVKVSLHVCVKMNMLIRGRLGKYTSGCFMCSPVSCGALMKLLSYTRSCTRTCCTEAFKAGQAWASERCRLIPGQIGASWA